jgi:hypothetical protein
VRNYLSNVPAILSWFIAVSLVILLTLFLSSEREPVWLLAPFLPLGLAEFFSNFNYPPELRGLSSDVLQTMLLVGGWLLYCGLFFGIVFTRRWRRTLLLAVLFVVVATNLHGCKSLLRTLASTDFK